MVVDGNQLVNINGNIINMELNIINNADIFTKKNVNNDSLFFFNKSSKVSKILFIIFSFFLIFFNFIFFFKINLGKYNFLKLNYN